MIASTPQQPWLFYFPLAQQAALILITAMVIGAAGILAHRQATGRSCRPDRWRILRGRDRHD